MQFTQPPEVYIRESQNASRLYWIWAPVLTAIALPVLTAWDAEFVRYWLLSERHGLLEFLHAFLPFLIACIALYMLSLKSVRTNRLHILWCLALIVGGIYLAGEESSWGQHYVGWSTPEFWAGVNDQQETNLHNTSHWLDQKPRLILILGIAVTGIIFPFLLKRGSTLLPRAFDWTYTPLIGVPLAIMVPVLGFYEDVVQLLGQEHLLALRDGEYQELFIVWYLFGYTLVLLRRARQAEREMKR